MAEKTILTKNGKINDFAMIDALKGWNKTLSNIEHQQEKKDLGEVENKLETQSVGEHFVEQAKKDTDKEMGKSQAVFNYDRYDNWEDKTANDARQLLKMQWEKKDEYPVWANDDNELYVGKNAPKGYKPIAEVYTDAEELSNAEKKAREQFKQELITTAEAEAFLNTDADRSKMIELFNQNYNHRDYRSKLINLYNDRQNEIIQNSIQKEIEDIDKRIKEEDKKHPLQASQFSFVGAGKFGATPTIQFTEEQRNLNATANILKDIKKDVDARINNRGFWKGLGNELFTESTLDLGITELTNNSQIVSALSQMEDKGFENMREDEKILLDALVAKEMANLLPPSSLAYNVGSGVGFSIPFMIGYGLTAIPAKALSKGAGKLVSNYVAKRVAEKGLGGAIAKATKAVATKAPKLTKAVKATGQGLTQAGVQTVISPHTYSNMAERQVGNIEINPQLTPDKLTAQFAGRNVDENTVGKALVSSFITNMTESLGGKALGEVGKIIFKPIAKVAPKSASWFTKLKSKWFEKGCDKLAQSTDFNGMLSEFGEEYIDQTLNAVFVGDQKLEDIYTGENAIQTALTTAAITFGMGLLGGGLGFGLQTEARHRYNKAIKRLDTAIPNQEIKNELINRIAMANNIDEQNAIINEIWQEAEALTKQGKVQEAEALKDQTIALTKYANAYNNLSTYNQYLNDQVQEQMKTEREHIRQNANADMDNHTIIAQHEGENVLVVGGKVAFNQDGTIDTANSSESVTITTPDGKRSIISPEKLSLVADMSFEELEQQAEQMVWQRINNEVSQAEQAVSQETQAPSQVGEDGMVRIPVSYEQASELSKQGFQTEDNGSEVSIVIAPQQEQTARQAISELQENEEINEEIKQEQTPPSNEETNTQEPQQPSYPTDESGEPIFIQMPIEQTAQVIEEFAEEDAENFITNKVAEAKKRLDKASKAKPKSTKLIEIKSEREAIKQEKQSAQAEYDYWLQVQQARAKASQQETTETPVTEAEQPNNTNVPTEAEPNTSNLTNQANQVDEEIKEPTFTEEILENGDKRITNYNSRGEVATIAIERNGKIASVDTFQEGKLFEHTEYDENGKATSVTRYDKQGNTVGTQNYDDKNQKKRKVANNLQNSNELGEITLYILNTSNGTYQMLKDMEALRKRNRMEFETIQPAYEFLFRAKDRGLYPNEMKELMEILKGTSLENKVSNWFTPAFEKKNSAIDNTTDTVETSNRGKQNDTATLQDNVPERKDTESVSNKQENKEEKTPEEEYLDLYLKETRDASERAKSSNLSSKLYPRNLENAIEKGDAETEAEYKKEWAKYLDKLIGRDIPIIDGTIENLKNTKGKDKNSARYKAHDYIIKSLQKRKRELTKTLTEEDKRAIEAVKNKGILPKNEVPFRQGENTTQSKPKAEGKGFTLSEQHKKELQAEATRRMNALRKAGKEFRAELNNNPDIVIVDKASDLPKEAFDAMSDEDKIASAFAKGWYSHNGKTYIILSNTSTANTSNAEDLKATLFHEAVAHKGLRELIGKKNFNKLCQAVYDAMPEKEREQIRYEENYARGYIDEKGNPKAKTDSKGNVLKDKKGEIIYHEGVSNLLIADEYMASLAEQISKSKGKTTIAEDIVQAIRTFLRKIGINLKLNQNDIKHLLHASYTKLKGNDADVVNTALGNKIKRTAIREKVEDGIRARFRLTQEEQDIISQAKANGTYLKAPNGKDTNLTPEQWARVRTKAFKEWFGDWELSYQKDYLLNGTPVSTLSGDEFKPVQGKKLTELVEDYFNSIGGKAISPIYGDVILDKAGADDSLAHGMGRTKAIAYASVKDVIENGILIDYHENHKGRGYDTAVISAPIGIKGERYFCYVTITRAKGSNRFYLHEVWTEKNLTSAGSNAVQGQPSHLQGNAKVLQNIVTAKESSKIVDENGEPKVVYHQTNRKVYINKETGENWDDLDWKSRMEWGERNDWEDYWEEKDFFEFSRTNARTTNEFDGFFFAPEYDEYHEYGDRTIAAFLNIRKPAYPNDYNIDPSKMDAGKEERLRLQRDGYDGVIRVYDGVIDEYIAFEPTQIKSATDNVGTYDSTNPDIRFRHNDIFISNAENAVLNIKQSKATPEQWIAMLKNNGGLKAGEDKWLGLEDWLKAQKGSITKDEVLKYIADNEIKVEEVEYSEDGEDIVTYEDLPVRSSSVEDWKQYGKEQGYMTTFWAADVLGGVNGKILIGRNNLKADGREVFVPTINGRYLQQIDNNFPIYYNTFEDAVNGLNDYFDKHRLKKVNRRSTEAINSTRLEYTTEGLENNREIALTVPTIESWNASDEIHFGDAGEGRAIAWIRFGETTDSEGNRVLVIDEIQSKRHQEGREKGYSKNEANKAFEVFRENLMEKYNLQSDQIYKALNSEEKEEYDKLLTAANEEFRTSSDIPDAPFDKNWHELAMKRMLRFAAENGYDKVAWTTGEQQADRYDMSREIKSIQSEDETITEASDGTPIAKALTIRTTSGMDIRMDVDANGMVRGGEYSGKQISDVLGKELGEKVMEKGNRTLTTPDLKLGGEGMKGFYDKILPTFMNKYGKKWGVKTESVELPSLGEDGLTMHSVDVTPEMRESVMQGQTMFRFYNGATTDELFDLIAEQSNYSYSGASEVFTALQDYFGGEIVSASWGAKHAIEEYGLIPVTGEKYSGEDGEYHHIEFRNDKGETFVESVPFVKAEDVANREGVRFRVDEALDTYAEHFSGIKETNGIVFDTPESLYEYALENGYDKEGAKEVLEQFTTNKTAAAFVPNTKDILFFAFKGGNPYAEALHEHIHYAIEQLGGIDKFLTLSNELANLDEVIVKFVSRNYKKDIEEEIITYSMQIAYTVNAIEELRNRLSKEAQTQLEEILNKTGYNKNINHGKEIERFTTESIRRVYEDHREHGRKQYRLASTHLRDNSQRGGEGATEESIRQEEKAGVNFRLSEETDATLSRIEQESSKTYDEITKIELPKAETPTEVAKNKQTERILFRFDKDFASMMALQNAIRNTELYKYNQEGKLGELNKGLFDSMAGLLQLIQKIEQAYNTQIDDNNNAYWLENASSSKAQERIEQLNLTHIQPLANILAEAEEILGQENLKHYALAKAGLERQRVKEEQARQLAQENGEEYIDADYAGLTGLLADMMGYTNKQFDELEKKPMEEVFAIATQNDIDLEQFIANCESKLGTLADRIWYMTAQLSDMQLRGQLEAGLISADMFNLLMYSGDAKELIEQNVKNGLITKGHAKYLKTQGYTIEQLRDKGYITEEQYKNFVKGKRRYQYYLPLKGSSELQAEDVIQYEHTKGKNQSKVRTAKGHRHKTNDPFVQLTSDCYGAIANEELNRWKRAIYMMCEKYPMDDFILDAQLMVKQFDGSLREATPLEIERGQFKIVKNRQESDVNATPLQKKEHIMYVYINGHMRTIFFKDKSLANAINTQGGKFGGLAKPLQWATSFQRWWAKNLTSRNPAFVGANTARDLQEAMFVNYVNLGAKALPVFLKAWNPTSKLQRALHRHLTGIGGNTPEDKLVQEYFANGGVTAYTQIAEYAKIKSEIKSMVANAKRSGWDPRKWWKAIIGWLERQTKHAELVSRIATYAIYRGTLQDYQITQNGQPLQSSVAKAIWESKEVTVNFDKRGEWSKYTNLTSLFFNAGRQSNRIHLKLMREHPKRYAAAKVLMVAVKTALPALSAWLTSLFFDDEDYNKLIEKYNKINRYTRYNNIVLLIGDNVVTIPISPSFAPTSMVAELAMQLAYNKEVNWDTWIPDALNASLSTWGTSAIGNVASSLYRGDMVGAGLSAMPVAVLEPILQLMTNRNYQGRAIMKEGRWVDGLPNFLKAYGSTNPYLLEASRKLNNLMGGTSVKPGKLNAINNPAGIQHLATSYGGGALTFYTDIASLALMLTTSEDASASDYLRQTPIVNRFFKGNIDRYMEQDAIESYYKAYDNLQVLSNRRSNLPKPERADYTATIEELKGRFKAFKNQIDNAKETKELEIESLGKSKSFAKEKKIKDDYRKEFVNIMQDFSELEEDINKAMEEY